MAGHPRYPWVDLDRCGTCGGTAWRVVDTPQGRMARCERCLRPRADERLVERITLGGGMTGGGRARAPPGAIG